MRLGPYKNSVPEENKITLFQVIQSLSQVQEFLRTVWLVLRTGTRPNNLISICSNTLANLSETLRISLFPEICSRTFTSRIFKVSRTFH